MNQITGELIEKLAKIEHEQWAHWTSYMLENLTEENISRWKRQIKTPYCELTEREKDSDRRWAIISANVTVDYVVNLLKERGMV